MKAKEIKLFLELNHIREDTPITGKSCIILIQKFMEEHHQLKLKEIMPTDEETGKFDLQLFQKEQLKWAIKNFGNKYGSGYRTLLGVMEEVGELAHAHLKAEQGIRINENHQDMKKDAVGDIVIYLVNYCSDNGLNLEECIRDAWQEVSQRDWNKNRING